MIFLWLNVSAKYLPWEHIFQNLYLHQVKYMRTIIEGRRPKFFFGGGDSSQMWVGGVADSQTRSKLLQITPKIAFFDANFTFRFPKSHKTLGWVNTFGKDLPKKTIFFIYLPLKGGTGLSRVLKCRGQTVWVTGKVPLLSSFCSWWSSVARHSLHLRGLREGLLDQKFLKYRHCQDGGGV